MDREGIKSAIVNIIQEINPDIDTRGLDPEKRIRDQLDLDSMDFLDIVMEIRRRYGVEVPEKDYIQLATLNSATNYLTPRINKQI